MDDGHHKENNKQHIDSKVIMKTIHVKQEHIDAGIRCCTDRCPIALAIKQQVACKLIAVRHGHVRLLYTPDKPLGTHAILPRSADRFIRNFDLLRSVSPFKFQLKEKELK